MRTKVGRMGFLLAGTLAVLGQTTALGADPALARFSAQWFGGLAKLAPVEGPMAEGVSAVQEARVGGKLMGWVFRTDQLPPAVRGKRGEIATWVALGADGKIRGIDVFRHREDPPWFNRLKKSFYRQFEGLSADGSGKAPDTVATATISSKAIVDDVLGACKVVLELPAVKAAVASTPAVPAAP